jgi:uncharacterized membrane protein
MALSYVAVFFWLAWLRHASFNSSGFDLGIYDQVTWNTLHGRWFFYTTTGVPTLHFSNHVSPNILLIALLYLLHSGPETLLFVQPLAIALGGLPLFWLSRQKLGSDLAALSLLAAYLLFPTLQIVNLWDYHPPVISVCFFMVAFYFLETRRPGWFVLFALLAMLGKEQLALQVAFLGGYALLRYRYWWAGGVTIGVALAWFFFVMNWLIPTYSTTESHLFLGYYADLGDSPAQIVLTALTRPDLVLTNLWQPAKLQYLVDVFTPFAWLPLLGLPILAIGAPSFAINLLSANTAMHDATGAQYGAEGAPWRAWAAMYGFFFAQRGLTRFLPALRRWITPALSLLLLTVALIWQLFRGFSPLALDPPHWEITAHDRLAQRFIAQIPPEASLAAQGKLYPHLSNRLIAYQLPDVNDADYVFFDVTTGTWPVHPNDIWALARNLLSSGQYGVLDAADGYLLLKRGLPNPTIPAEFYTFAHAAESAAPQYPLHVQFRESRRLLGFDLLDDPRRAETAVRLYWQPLQPLPPGLRLYPFFVDAENYIIETTEQRPQLTQLWYPSELWPPGQIIISETMPWPLGQRWSLAVGVLTGPNWADWSQRLPITRDDTVPPLRRFEANTWLRAATFERPGRLLAEIPPPDPDSPPAHPVSANLGDQLELRGYDLSGPMNNELEVTLYWRGQQPMSLDYSVFIHLLGPDGALVAQHDGQPWYEVNIPTSSWQPGENVLDRHTLALPADLPPGPYQLQVGVYYWETLERLPLLENGAPVNNFVDLGTITLE